MDVYLDEVANVVRKGGGELAMKIAVYPDEVNDKDIIASNMYYEQVRQEFGMRYMRGTAVVFHNVESNLLYSMEHVIRSFLKNNKIEHAVEIGTWRGVSTALLAHYADKVTTIDIAYHPEALPLWYYFGVKDKIKYIVVENNAAKKNLIDGLDFDFAFVDGNHNFSEVAFDYECVKKCGRILFHDYGVEHLPDVTDFVDRLTKENVTIRAPFAYWKKNGHDDS